VKVSGYYENNAKYGKQLSIETLERISEASIQAKEKYLASGAVAGIGERIAKKIIERFGEDSFECISETPEKLTEISGISLRMAQRFCESFHKAAEERSVMLALLEFGISPVLSKKIYECYKGDSIGIVKKNPFALSEQIQAIGFRTADAIAEKAGIQKESPVRVKAGIKYLLLQEAARGSTYMRKSELVSKAWELLQIREDIITRSLITLSVDKAVATEIIANETAVYLSELQKAENYIAQKLMFLAANVSDRGGFSREELDKPQGEDGAILAQKQKQAVIEAMSSGVLVITGGPGTGKTTLIKTLIAIMEKQGFSISLAAPTGRAAKRMSDASGRKACTIHRLLEISYNPLKSDYRQSFRRNEDYPLESEVVIIDESSMMDIYLMSSLLRAIAPGTRLILAGDADQIPSVGPGNILRDIIGSGSITVVRLTDVFRQAQESGIVANAHRINKGEFPNLKHSDDFCMQACNDKQEMPEIITALLQARLPKFLKCETTDIQVLTPTRLGELGVANLNRVLQESLNPPSEKKREKEFRSTIFREGDKVMQVRNNYNACWHILDSEQNVLEKGAGVFNGDSGVIMGITDEDEDEDVIVKFDDGRIASYSAEMLEELELSYAITIHKSQGSEYKAVVMPVCEGPQMLISKNLLYTAVTRAKEQVVLVGSKQVLWQMVQSDNAGIRNTNLRYKIKQFAKIYRQEEA
jgi:exodeoxyribonuclease V alpha subunit